MTPLIWRSLFCVSLAGVLSAEPPVPAAPPVQPRPWNLAELKQPPEAEWGARDGLLQQVYYSGAAYQGKPTKVFAWVGRPEGSEGKAGVFPAVVLVHGGGGRAFAEWANHWAQRGYCAIAMDTAGQGPDGKSHAAAGPDQRDETKFRALAESDSGDAWTFHAVAAAIRGASLLLSLPEVDKNRLALTGISWGGYLTCIIAGVDDRFKAAVPVYGCGFLADNSVWKPKGLAELPPAERRDWVLHWDPSRYIGDARCPVLFLNGNNDFAYPLDSYRKTLELVPPERRTVSIQVSLKHGHYWDFPEVDAFIDAAVNGGKPLLHFEDVFVCGGDAGARISAPDQVAKAELHFTTDTGAWQTRKWTTVPAKIDKDSVVATLPESRPLCFFLSAVDARNCRVSTSHCELEAAPSSDPAVIPSPKLEQDFYDWHRRHAQALWWKDLMAPDMVFLGDSITHLWGGEPSDPKGGRGADSWRALTAGRRALNLGFGWDRTQNLLWRIDHGELDGLAPRDVVILIGTNNLAGTARAAESSPEAIAAAVRAVVARVRGKCPDARISLMAVFPRGAKSTDPVRAKIAAINRSLAGIPADVPNLRFIDLAEKLAGADGSISPEIMPDALHPGAKGYEIWAQALR